MEVIKEIANVECKAADSENEEDKKPTQNANMKTEQSSGREEAESQGSPKPLNSMCPSLCYMQ